MNPEIPDHTAADGDDRVRAVESSADQLVVQPGRGLECLARVAGRHGMHGDRLAPRPQVRGDRVGVHQPDRRVREHRDLCAHWKSSQACAWLSQ